MIQIDASGIHLITRHRGNSTYVLDTIRKKWVVLTREEYVRQITVGHLVKKGYSPSKIAVERMIQVGDRRKRFDIVVYGKDHRPWMLVECKEPEENITRETLYQLLNYQRTLQTGYWMLTNGHQTYCMDATDVTNLKWLEELPAYEL